MRHRFSTPACPVCLLVLLGCSKEAPRRPADTPPPAAVATPAETASSVIDTTEPPLDTVLGRCAVALKAPTDQHRGVIEALRAAYGLEGSLVSESGLETTTREAIYAHYRKGFGDKLAEQLTDYSWHPQSHQVRATDPALTVPDTVGVLELKQDRAVVAWIAPTAFRRQWAAPRCFVDRLVREDGNWIIEGREP